MPMKDLIFLSNYIKMEYGEKPNVVSSRPKMVKRLGKVLFARKKQEKNQLGGNKHYGKKVLLSLQ